MLVILGCTWVMGVWQVFVLSFYDEMLKIDAKKFGFFEAKQNIQSEKQVFPSLRFEAKII
jgi:hypothetical protein